MAIKLCEGLKGQSCYSVHQRSFMGTTTGMDDGLTQQNQSFYNDKKQFTIVGFDLRGYGESRPLTHPRLPDQSSPLPQAGCS